jgi:alpha-ketoglutarate-dependent taurine dioxygenase
MKAPHQVKRRVIPAASQAQICVTPLSECHPLPALVSPAVPGVDLIRWSAENRGEVDQLLLTHKALLFRGFHAQHSGKFADFVRNTAEGDPLEYRDRSTPRTRISAGIYTSTIYPADRRIRLHNEGTYWTKWPMKIYFGCAAAPVTGGETPIANVANVHRRLPPAVRESFREKGFMLIRNYNDGFGLTWQEVFQTEHPAEVEAYCSQNDIRFEWRDGGRLRTAQVRPAIRRHPRTGELVWFNHAAFFHHSSYAPELREQLISELGINGLPYNTLYGDASEIPADVVAEVLGCYEAEQTLFTWQEHDILLLDNMSVAHAREPYTGHRLILTSMNEACSEP